ncbi:MAG: diacylglycerol kinase family lipid kinase [candidate division Zixibacteria bacterium]|nr:diacylglycerol kinase family lipid kinase [Candidatus Tariuqbacter arcticus]
MKVLFIINPFSGIKDWEAVVGYIKRSWGGSGHKFEIAATWKVGEGESLARRAVQDLFDMVVAVGGDGTINEVARGLLWTETALGVVPGGSGNGFARVFHIPLVRKIAVRKLLKPHFKRMDVGEVNGKIFLVTCGAGMDAHISSIFDKGPRRGLWSYYLASFKIFVGYRPPHMKIITDDGEIEADPVLITAANLRQYGGGVKIAPGADPFDGYLDLAIVNYMNPFLNLYHLPKLFTGRVKRVPSTIILRFKEATIITEVPCPVHIDGDPMEPSHTLHIKVLPAALKIALIGGKTK